MPARNLVHCDPVWVSARLRDAGAVAAVLAEEDVAVRDLLWSFDACKRPAEIADRGGASVAFAVTKPSALKDLKRALRALSDGALSDSLVLVTTTPLRGLPASTVVAMDPPPGCEHLWDRSGEAAAPAWIQRFFQDPRGTPCESIANVVELLAVTHHSVHSRGGRPASGLAKYVHHLLDAVELIAGLEEGHQHLEDLEVPWEFVKQFNRVHMARGGRRPKLVRLDLLSFQEPAGRGGHDAARDDRGDHGKELEKGEQVVPGRRRAR